VGPGGSEREGEKQGVWAGPGKVKGGGGEKKRNGLAQNE
jgi:hypothetical protein